MVVEVAFLEIDPEKAAAFEAAVASCELYFKAAKGCRSMALARVAEDPAQYRLLVAWDTVEDHMVGFRTSPGFQKWREIAGPFFVEPPQVEHLDVVARYFGDARNPIETV
jgi:quinol monooxygenase YgiN